MENAVFTMSGGAIWSFIAAISYLVADKSTLWLGKAKNFS
jgi:hypothetical protein